MDEARTRAPRRLVVFDAYPHVFGGAHRVAALIADGVTGRGWTCSVVFPAGGPAPRRLSQSGLPVTIVDAPRALRRYGERLDRLARLGSLVALPIYWLRLWWWLRRHADVVWAHDLRGWVLAGPAARLARCRLVWHVHAPASFADGGSRRLVRLANRIAAGCSDAVVVPSSEGGAPARARVVTNAVALPDWQWRDPLDDLPIVLAIGRLHPDKGFDLLVEASEHMRRRGVRHRLVIVGPVQSGHESYAAALREAAGRSGGAVELTGPVDDTEPWLRAASVHVQPSRQEPFGLATLEAMAAGMPVVAARVGGLAWLFVDEVSGLYLPAGDVEALAATLERVVADAALRQRLGAAARARVSERFGVAAFTDGVVGVLEEVG